VSGFDFKKEIVEVDGKTLPISRARKGMFFKELTGYTRKKYKRN
jgi:hypothetical protein